MPLSIVGIQETIYQIRDNLLKVPELPVDVVKGSDDEFSIVCCIYRPKELVFSFNFYEPKLKMQFKRDDKVIKENIIPLDKMFDVKQLEIIGKMAQEWCLKDSNTLLCKEV
ncbi:MAG: hypothetical protein HC875_39030 [Anaerolineales bacterium]|nr:hypothetical protein [Anaerolineales bacterium]